LHRCGQHGDLKALSILLCICTDEYPLMVAGSCQYHGWRSKVRLSDYMRCVVCLDLSGHTTSPCVLSLCKTLFAFFGMLLVVVGYHLVLDGPHVLRCVLSNIRCYMQCIYMCRQSMYLIDIFTSRSIFRSIFRNYYMYPPVY